MKFKKKPPKIKNVAKNWRDFCYAKHKRHITGPSLNVKEHDGTGKSGEKKFFEVITFEVIFLGADL